MSLDTTHMLGKKYPVTAYVTPEVFAKIEEKRGDVARSYFVGKLISEVMGE